MKDVWRSGEGGRGRSAVTLRTTRRYGNPVPLTDLFRSTASLGSKFDPREREGERPRHVPLVSHREMEFASGVRLEVGIVSCVVLGLSCLSSSTRFTAKPRRTSPSHCKSHPMHSLFGVCSARAQPASQPASQSAPSICMRKHPEWTDRFCSAYMPSYQHVVNQSVRRSSRQVVTVHRFHPFTHTSAMFCPAMRCVVIRVVHREVRRVGLGSGDPEAWRGGGGATTTTSTTT
ncbi:hypothetical protein IWZ01DRAFT_310819 [Phyllosticta capitalensis]